MTLPGLAPSGHSPGASGDVLLRALEARVIPLPEETSMSSPHRNTPAPVLEHEHATGLLILTVTGELDATTAPLLRRHLAGNLPDHTVIDLSRVTFLGVAGLQVLEAAALAGHERRRLALVTSSPTDLRILRLFGLDVRVTVYPRLSDAIRAISSQVS
ncbi:STAS domain-containing protein [Amycolatopsis lurida]|uniref:STAS domain-containing protein n=1 Tax=Amycolatopsis lurida TaxID=31959 RepID=UPI003659DA7B